LEAAKNLRNTTFSETVIIPDLTQEQRREQAEMNNEVERRNRDLTQEDQAKNLEWMVVGARGERRMVKGSARTRGARCRARSRRRTATGERRRPGSASPAAGQTSPRSMGPGSRRTGRTERAAGQAAEQQADKSGEERERVRGEQLGGGDGRRAPGTIPTRTKLKGTLYKCAKHS
jgi:hypothetical protein